MSTWTHEEVDQLELKGNNHCEATWLAKAPAVGQQGRPTAGSSIDVFKRFVIDVYEHQKYYVAASAAKKPTVPLAAAKDNTHSQQPVSSTFLSAAPSQQPAPDFLDFASFHDDNNNAGSTWSKVETAPCPAVDPFACAAPSHLNGVSSNSSNYSTTPVPFDPFAPSASTTQQTLNYTTSTCATMCRFIAFFQGYDPHPHRRPLVIYLDPSKRLKFNCKPISTLNAHYVASLFLS